MNSYTYSVACADCEASWHVGQVTVSLPIMCTDNSHYVCPRCFLEVVIPRRVEARLLDALREEQADHFGNPSPFRTRLAAEIKRHAHGHRPYALVGIPEMTIMCPEDGIALEPWRNYPGDPPLICPKCGSRACRATAPGEIAGGVLTAW